MNRRRFLSQTITGALALQAGRRVQGASAGTLFPKGFRWGTATAAYQIEGATKEGGRGVSVWDTFCRVPGAIQTGETGDVACDHYHRYKEDVALMKQLGLGAYRFSIAWPRIVPAGTGTVNPAGLDFYDRLLDRLHAAGVEPFVTLYHWDLPQPLQDKGGWANRDTADAFAAYADVVVRRLGDRIRYWITHNEPLSVTYEGHMTGEHAPGIKNPAIAIRAAHHILLSHGKALQAIRASRGARAEIGIVNVLQAVEPAGASDEDKATARRLDGQANRWFLDPVLKGSYPADILPVYGALLGADAAMLTNAEDLKTISMPTDFLGVNYYTRLRVAASAAPPMFAEIKEPEGERTEMGWEVYPEGLYRTLVRVHSEYKPAAIYVTENGAAFADPAPRNGTVADPKRVAYLRDHFAAAHRAIAEGVPVKGYFVWSLMDNFEWAFGTSKRFGVVYVDFATQRRTVKESGRWYAEVIRRNGLA